MALTPEDLVLMAKHPAGSRVIESFLQAASIQQRRHFIDKFTGHFVEVLLDNMFVLRFAFS
jgi:hypothetical protein